MVNFDKEKVEKTLREYLDPSVNLILQIGNYILDGGGKRVRPYLVLKFSKALRGYNEEKDYILSAALEYLHTASLLHDDVVDGSEKRRGKPTVNRVFGNDTTVLVGDYMYANALYLFSIYGDIDMIKNVSDSVKKMAEGQLLELKKIADFETSFDDYYKIVLGKTAVLFGSCCYVGTALASSDQNLKDMAYNYGLNIGIAFQIVDDILDYEGKEEKVGKSLMNDLKEGKITYPLLVIKEELKDEDKSFIKSVILDKNPPMENLLKAKKIVEDYQGVEKAKEHARDYVRKAIENLKDFPDNKDKEDLINLAYYIVKRDI
ncbi:polyprenyl synthetase family protein [Sulfurihydrogenibium sp.]|uniref:polyprenyl synthetase family protein n=1 Tax=Sulfurihydrogenibium sp. TaxID=2053621 RepID=UPI00260B7985|nr:polyprenyl synthetase family protein [Sulfurihydrogenibium sp.]